MNLNQIFNTIKKLAKKEKVDVFVVGGYVRDEMMRIDGLIADLTDKKIKDVDFVVIGSGLEFARKFDRQMKQEGSLVEFPDFDTARYVITHDTDNMTQDNIELEFAGARTEVYAEKSRKPKVTATSLEEDLKRRDFTVNSMAVDVANLSSRPAGKAGEGSLSKAPAEAKKRDSSIATLFRNDNVVVDPFNGQKDLKNKILRTPLDPKVTFSEDPLRLMRAARFASQLGFSIEANTYQAMIDNVYRLKIISAERIKEELFKIFATPKPSIGLRILYDTGSMAEFLPEVCALTGAEEIYGQQHKDVLEHTFKVVDNLAERTNNVLLRLAGFFHDIAKPNTKKFISGRGWTFDMHEHLGKKMVKDIGRRLRFSLDESKYIAKMVRWHQHPINLMDEGITDSAIRRLIVNLGDDLNELLMLCRSDITTGNPIKKNKRLKNYDHLERRIAEVLEKDKLRAFQSPVRGDEIMKECKLKPGPTVGKIKKALEEAILDGKIPNDYEATKKYFEEIKEEMMEDVKDWERSN